MKMTKEITVKNIFDEVVTIEPIPYKTAIKIVEFQELSARLLNVIGKFLVSAYENGETNIKESGFYKRMMENEEKAHNEEMELREQYNYWYVGRDNLDKADQEKYSMRKNS